CGLNTYIILKQGDFLYNFRCRTRIAGGFMIRDYVANQSKDNNKRNAPPIKYKETSMYFV
ncbi:hypothetical protein, partial [Veillonella sp.]|uniref:hypothetical protein n=1 Tax=Veillonella sp. TaxID=1926307 RepID=UPI002905039D